MSKETQVALKILTALLLSVFGTVSSVAFNDWVKSQHERDERIQKIYDFVIRQEGVDLSQNRDINEIKLEQKETHDMVFKLYESLRTSNNQLSEVDEYLKDKQLSNGRNFR